MVPTKEGQIVKFHSPLADENPDQQYVVLEIKEDGERSRVDIKALNTGLSFPPVNTVLLSDLEVIEVDTSDLTGHIVTINKSDFSQVVGKVIKVSEQKINLDLSKGIHGVETNVWLTILDDKGNEHMGTLYVTP
ncbi:hypothetical protein SAMN05421789_11739 [Kaistella chaponensis]|uniref:Uncharacterized protein n=1 Tax=Kaistella chaponensis TaxID=713588 RepID=A0A1N7NU39_9FLAO|nr:hypothetical protein [Kaistella chaponensis]SIT01883.1 hypothetical protein SAMN05421789_11739 [Kaistella chaponensis]